MLYALTRCRLSYSLTSNVLLQQRELEPLLLRLFRLVGLVGLVGLVRLGGGLWRHGQRLGVVRRGENGRQVRGCRGRGQLDGLGLWHLRLCLLNGLLNGLRLCLLNGLRLRL